MFLGLCWDQFQIFGRTTEVDLPSIVNMMHGRVLFAIVEPVLFGVLTELSESVRMLVSENNSNIMVERFNLNNAMQ